MGMLSSAGLRIERLLYFGLILIFLCWAETYISATAAYFSDSDTRVLDGLLQKLTKERSALEQAFERKDSTAARNEREHRADELRKELGLSPRLAESRDSDTYFSLLQKITNESQFSTFSMDPKLYAATMELIDITKSPQEIIEAVTIQRNLAVKNTATVMGIESPRFLSLQYGSADFKIPSVYLAVILLVVIYPLSIVWLGSFYITRQRELMMIRFARDHKATFPHILNWLVVDFSKMNAQLGTTQTPKQRRQNLKQSAIATVAFRCLIVFLIVVLITFPIGYSSMSLYATIVPSLFFTAIASVFLFIIFGLGLALCLQEALLLKGKVFYE